jgi:uncharacterized protein (DUF488 family)
MSRSRVPRGGVVLSLGYEGRSLSELVDTLRFNNVRVLMDVRENPVSRKPGFGKRQLSDALDAAGIEYRHDARLGNPKDNRDAFRTGNLAAGKRRYMRHLNNGARTSYETLVKLALTQRVAVLCYERDEAKCHRSCIVEQAQKDYPALLVSRL